MNRMIFSSLFFGFFFFSSVDGSLFISVELHRFFCNSLPKILNFPYFAKPHIDSILSLEFRIDSIKRNPLFGGESIQDFLDCLFIVTFLAHISLRVNSAYSITKLIFSNSSLCVCLSSMQIMSLSSHVHPHPSGAH